MFVNKTIAETHGERVSEGELSTRVESLCLAVSVSARLSQRGFAYRREQSRTSANTLSSRQTIRRTVAKSYFFVVRRCGCC